MASICFLNGGLFPETRRNLLVQTLLQWPVIGPIVAKLTNYDMFSYSLRKIFSVRRPSNTLMFINIHKSFPPPRLQTQKQKKKKTGPSHRGRDEGVLGIVAIQRGRQTGAQADSLHCRLYTTSRALGSCFSGDIFFFAFLIAVFCSPSPHN